MTTNPPSRLSVLKTYRLYINGQFRRSESGRTYSVTNTEGLVMAHIAQASRKDFRDAVVAARKAQAGWQKTTAYERGQILYRMAQMLEGRCEQFVTELKQAGYDTDAATAEVLASVDRLVHYAGWCGKVEALYSTVNPVASGHFNASMLEPTGVVSVVMGTGQPLLQLVSLIGPAICTGNTVVVLIPLEQSFLEILGEVLHTSDLPGGVVNLLTGDPLELAEHFASHMDVNATVYAGDDEQTRKTIREKGALNLKRIVVHKVSDWLFETAQSPKMIRDLMEVKTIWHPVG